MGLGVTGLILAALPPGGFLGCNSPVTCGVLHCAVSSILGKFNVSWRFRCSDLDGNLFLGDYDAAFLFF